MADISSSYLKMGTVRDTYGFIYEKSWYKREIWKFVEGEKKVH